MRVRVSRITDPAGRQPLVGFGGSPDRKQRLCVVEGNPKGGTAGNDRATGEFARGERATEPIAVRWHPARGAIACATVKDARTRAAARNVAMSAVRARLATVAPAHLEQPPPPDGVTRAVLEHRPGVGQRNTGRLHHEPDRPGIQLESSLVNSSAKVRSGGSSTKLSPAHSFENSSRPSSVGATSYTWDPPSRGSVANA